MNARCHFVFKILRSFEVRRPRCVEPELKNDKSTVKTQLYILSMRAIRRHFGKQMNKETKLRIHNITAKAALKFGSEAWVLKKRE